ncbi:MAG: four helix bundle protein [bacterium]|nr:four helix bundle protein [bacterium]
MNSIKSYRELEVWKRAKGFAVLIYRVTDEFPGEERFGLISQLRRAAVSIASNIAEGFGRKSLKEKIQFLRVSYGSCAEIGTQIEIAHELGYISSTVFREVLDDLEVIMKMINSAIKKIGDRE